MTPEQLASQIDHLLALLEVGVGVCLLILLVTSVNLVTRRRDHAETARQIADRRSKDEEMWGLLKIVKGWAESARTHTKDAVLSAGAAPAMERHLIDEVRKVPDRTADRTADRVARQDEKLDTIHNLVNSSHSALLKMNAEDKRRIANLTGHAEDIKAAELAEKRYEDHEAEQKKQAAAKTAPNSPHGCGVPAVLVGLLLVAWTAGRADAGATLRHDNEVRAVEWWDGRSAQARSCR